MAVAGGAVASRRCFAAAAGATLPGQGLAVVPAVRPTSGEAAAAWIKESMAAYYARPDRYAYRTPAAWTLRQMDDRFSFLKPDSVVIDLGSFPGGWSEVAVERTSPGSSTSLVIGVDIVRMEPLRHHTFVEGDIAADETLDRVLAVLGDRRADVVLSDLATPSTGLKFEDHLGSMQSCLYAAKIMERTLRLGGWFIAKHFWGPENQNWRTYLDSRFQTVRTIKPPASRPIHREMFVACRGFSGRQPIAEEVPKASIDFVKHEGRDRWDAEIRRPGGRPQSRGTGSAETAAVLGSGAP